MNEPNQEQFGRIYDQYIDRIYRFVYLKVNSQEIAEDLTSKVFLNCWKSYQKDAIKNPEGFLYRVARNAVTDHYREKNKVRMVGIDTVAQIVDQKANIHEKAMLNADIEVIKSAISGLKKDYQDVLIWYYLEDMNTEHIAQLLDKPVGTVRVMIHRGLDSLKDRLGVKEV